MENYIAELIETLPQLDGLDKSFHSFYVCTAVRKFFFFLDPLRTGKIKIQDILASSFLDDLLELRDQGQAHNIFHEFSKCEFIFFYQILWNFCFDFLIHMLKTEKQCLDLQIRHLFPYSTKKHWRKNS